MKPSTGSGRGATSTSQRLQHRRQLLDVDVVRVDQHLAGRERHEGRVDVHRLRAAALDLVDAEARAEMAAQPLDAHQVGDVRARHEQVAAAAHEVGGVEDRLELVDRELHRLAGLQVRHAVVVVVELVRQLRPRRRGPARAGPEVLLEQRAVGVALEVARAPAHRALDDLVADDEVGVARAGDAEAARRPARRPVLLREVDRVGPADLHALAGEDRDEVVELLLRELLHELRVPEAGGEPVERLRGARQVEDHREVVGRDRRAVEAADDDLLQRVPLVPGHHRASAAPAIRRGRSARPRSRPYARRRARPRPAVMWESRSIDSDRPLERLLRRFPISRAVRVTDCAALVRTVSPR